MDWSHDENELQEIDEKLSEDGMRCDLNAEHKMRYVWRLYVRSDSSLKSSVEDINKLRKQQAEDMLQVENYISHIQQLSDEQQQFIKDYEKENDTLKDESKAIKDLLEGSGATETTAGSSTLDQIQHLVKQQGLLTDSFKQLEFEREVLSETLSEHSSYFNEKNMVVHYLNERNDVTDMIKAFSPVEKIKILMDLVQEQRVEIDRLKIEEGKLKEFSSDELHEDNGEFSMDTFIEKQKSIKDEKEALKKDILQFNNILDSHPELTALCTEDSKCFEKLESLVNVNRKHTDELDQYQEILVRLKKLLPADEEIDTPSQMLECFVKIHTQLKVDFDSRQAELTEIGSLLKNAHFVSAFDDGATELQKLFDYLADLRKEAERLRLERENVREIFQVDKEDMDFVADLKNAREASKETIRLREEELQMYEDILSAKTKNLHEFKDTMTMPEKLECIVQTNQQQQQKLDLKENQISEIELTLWEIFPKQFRNNKDYNSADENDSDEDINDNVNNNSNNDANSGDDDDNDKNNNGIREKEHDSSDDGKEKRLIENIKVFANEHNQLKNHLQALDEEKAVLSKILKDSINEEGTGDSESVLENVKILAEKYRIQKSVIQEHHMGAEQLEKFFLKNTETTINDTMEGSGNFQVVMDIHTKLQEECGVLHQDQNKIEDCLNTPDVALLFTDNTTTTSSGKNLSTSEKIQKLITLQQQEKSKLQKIQNEFNEHCDVVLTDDKLECKEDGVDQLSFSKVFRHHQQLKETHLRTEKNIEAAVELIKTSLLYSEPCGESLEDNIKIMLNNHEDFMTKYSESVEEANNINLLLQNNVAADSDSNDASPSKNLMQLINEKNILEASTKILKEESEQVVKALSSISDKDSKGESPLPFKVGDFVNLHQELKELYGTSYQREKELILFLDDHDGKLNCRNETPRSAMDRIKELSSSYIMQHKQQEKVESAMQHVLKTITGASELPVYGGGEDNVLSKMQQEIELLVSKTETLESENKQLTEKENDIRSCFVNGSDEDGVDPAKPIADTIMTLMKRNDQLKQETLVMRKELDNIKGTLLETQMPTVKNTREVIVEEDLKEVLLVTQTFAANGDLTDPVNEVSENKTIEQSQIDVDHNTINVGEDVSLQSILQQLTKEHRELKMKSICYVEKYEHLNKILTCIDQQGNLIEHQLQTVNCVEIDDLTKLRVFIQRHHKLETSHTKILAEQSNALAYFFSTESVLTPGTVGSFKAFVDLVKEIQDKFVESQQKMQCIQTVLVENLPELSETDTYETIPIVQKLFIERDSLKSEIKRINTLVECEVDGDVTTCGSPFSSAVGDSVVTGKIQNLVSHNKLLEGENKSNEEKLDAAEASLNNAQSDLAILQQRLKFKIQAFEELEEKVSKKIQREVEINSQLSQELANVADLSSNVQALERELEECSKISMEHSTELTRSLEKLQQKEKECLQAQKELKGKNEEHSNALNSLMEKHKAQKQLLEAKHQCELDMVNEERDRYSKLIEEMKLLRLSFATVEEEKSVIEKKILRHDEELEGHKMILESLEEDHAVAVKSLHSEYERVLEEERTRQKNEKDVLKKGIAGKCEELDQIKSLNQGLIASSDLLKKELAEKCEEMDQIRSLNQGLISSSDLLKKGIAGKCEDMDQIKSLNQGLIASSDLLKKELAEKCEEMDQIRSLNQRLIASSDLLKKELAGKCEEMDQIKSLNQGLNASSESLKDLQEKLLTLKMKLKKRNQELKHLEDSEASYQKQIVHLQETNSIQNELLSQLKLELQETRQRHGQVLHESQSLKRLADRESGRTKDVASKVTRVKTQNSDLKNTLKAAIEELNQL